MTNIKPPRGAWHDAFDEWAREHDGDIDKYELNEIEWSEMCFMAGAEFALRNPAPAPADAPEKRPWYCSCFDEFGICECEAPF